MSTHAAAEIISRNNSYEADKESAREIQHSLVPAGNLKIPGAEVAYRFSPFAEVGGDFADFFCLPDGLIGIYIGDVVGKGLSAAMYAALVMGTLRGINKTGEDTAAVLALLNKRLLVRPVSGRYCATIYALFNPLTRLLTFSNACSPPMGCTNCEITSMRISDGTGWENSGADVRENRPMNHSTTFSRERRYFRAVRGRTTTSRQSP
jgi:hypothetical protein